MSTELTEVTKAVAEFDRVAAGLAELSKQYVGVVYEVTTTKGLEEARAARAAIRAPRYEVERIRKAAKAPILALGKRLDSEAARITAELEKLEKPIHEQIVHEEQRKERERQAKIEAENKRLADIHARIDAIRNLPVEASGQSSADILALVARAEAIQIGPDFGEFIATARAAHTTTVAALKGLHAQALADEAERERIQREREELARLRAEEEKRQAAERARIAEEERVAREAREAEDARRAEALRKEREALEAQRAEQERQAAEDRARIAEAERIAREAQKAEAARQAEETARIRAEQEAAAQAERDRIAAEEARLAAERAEFARQQEEARRNAEEAEQQRLAAETAEREREEQAKAAAKRAKYPGDAAILNALSTHFEVPVGVARKWLAEHFAKRSSEEAAA